MDRTQIGNLVCVIIGAGGLMGIAYGVNEGHWGVGVSGVITAVIGFSLIVWRKKKPT